MWYLQGLWAIPWSCISDRYPGNNDWGILGNHFIIIWVCWKNTIFLLSILYNHWNLILSRSLHLSLSLTMQMSKIFSSWLHAFLINKILGYFPIKSTYLITENETSISSDNNFFAQYTLRHLYFNHQRKKTDQLLHTVVVLN